MDGLSQDLQECYDRARREIDAVPGDPRAVISADDVLRAHFFLAQFFAREGEPIAIPGYRNAQLLLSAVGRQSTGLSGRLKWADPLHQCATLFYGLVKNHPFHDGNKRTALLVALYNLHRLRRTPTAPQADFELVAVRTAGNDLKSYAAFESFKRGDDAEVRFLADFLRRNSRRNETRVPVVTYQDLDRILRRHRCGLENPQGNYIDVVKTVEERHGILRKRRVVSKKVLQIGFPRWSAQVQEKALRSVLAATGLNAANGFDSAVIFHDAEPFEALIDTYREPLKRLRQK
jgi:prophage maintenance system killer protein